MIGYRYSGKPKGLLRLARKYVKLDIPAWRLPWSGTVLHELYINVNDYTLAREGLPGRVRVRLVRGPWRGQPEDPTAFQDIPLLPGFSDWLTTHVAFEYAQKGRPIWWEMKIEEAEATISTRYGKTARR